MLRASVVNRNLCYWQASLVSQSNRSVLKFKRHSHTRNLHTSLVRRVDIEPLRPSSKVEESVLAFKNDVKLPPAVVKASLGKRVMDELKHYYHGFRLLFIDVRISWNLALRLLEGEALTRREKKQLVRTTSDVFRLVPFSVFIIVPFMEFTLPIFLKFFPNMLPSTFQTADDREAKIKTTLKVKLEMAKFLQQTLDEMSLKGNGHQSQTAKEFADFFVKIRHSGQQASNEEILRFSKLFEDEITLDSLSRPQLLALCRVLEIQPTPAGTNSLLRFQLRMRLRSLAADDKLIQKEGIDSLSIGELQAACRARGMRSSGVSEIRLKSQLFQWLELSLNEKVPPSLLLLSRALYLPDNDSPQEQLVATIAALPDSFATQTRDAISQRRGKTDNAARIAALKVEQAKIQEERLDFSPSMGNLSPADAATLETALESIGVQRKRLLIAKEELTELKEEMAEYQEDVEELKDFLNAPERNRLVLRESKAARRLFLSVNKMIHQLDSTVDKLEEDSKRRPSDESEEIVSIEELISSIHRLQAVENSSKLEQIVQILETVDQDRDGVVRVDDVMKVIELLDEEEAYMSPEQMKEILHLVNKEQVLEMEEKLGKSLVQLRRKGHHQSFISAAAATMPTPALGNQDLSIEQIPVVDLEKHVQPVLTRNMLLKTLDAEEVDRLLTFSQLGKAAALNAKLTEMDDGSRRFRARAGSNSGS